MLKYACGESAAVGQESVCVAETVCMQAVPASIQIQTRQDDACVVPVRCCGAQLRCHVGVSLALCVVAMPFVAHTYKDDPRSVTRVVARTSSCTEAAGGTQQQHASKVQVRLWACFDALHGDTHGVVTTGHGVWPSRG